MENDDFDELIVEKRGDSLTLERPKRRGDWLRNGNRPETTVYVAAPTLSAIQVSSSADVDAKSLTCARLDARASSGSDITVSITDSVEATTSSEADINVYGSPSNVDVRSSSGGDVDIHSAL